MHFTIYKKKYTQLTIAIIVFNFIHFDESECLFILFHTSNVVVFFYSEALHRHFLMPHNSENKIFLQIAILFLNFFKNIFTLDFH